MNIIPLDSLLQQEMLEITGGNGAGSGASSCTCVSGARQGPGKTGTCTCKGGAGQSTDPDSGISQPDQPPIYICQSGAYQIKP